MARFIDGEYLEYILNCIKADSISTESVRTCVRSLETADVVEREKINKAIEEISSKAEECFENDYDGLDEYTSGIGVGLNDALKILKSHIGE